MDRNQMLSDVRACLMALILNKQGYSVEERLEMAARQLWDIQDMLTRDLMRMPDRE